MSDRAARIEIEVDAHGEVARRFFDADGREMPKVSREQVAEFMRAAQFVEVPMPDQPTLFERLLTERGLTAEQVAIVLQALEEVCDKCRNGDINCQCWNDE